MMFLKENDLTVEDFKSKFIGEIEYLPKKLEKNNSDYNLKRSIDE
jgi:hypothetical protein